MILPQTTGMLSFKTKIWQQIRCHSTTWKSTTFDVTVFDDKNVPFNYQLELGQANLSHQALSETAPAILAVHPSGSTYKQWSGLAPLLTPNKFSGLYGLNMFGYGLSDKWNAEHREQTIQDQVLMVTSAASAAGEKSWHLVGHSMGAGSVLATAGTYTDLTDTLASITVFEPNLFSLLQVGNAEEQRILADGDGFFKEMMQAAKKEDWDMWGRLFYRFWFDGRWDDLDKRTQKVLVGTTVPHTIHEIMSIKWAINQGPDLARTMLDRLASLPCKKTMVISAVPGIGSKDSLRALANLLRRETGFKIVHAPEGGHMGPVTHKDTVLPLLLPR